MSAEPSRGHAQFDAAPLEVVEFVAATSHSTGTDSEDHADPLKSANESSKMFTEMCENTEGVKDQIRGILTKPARTTLFELYHAGGTWQKIAKHPVFENVTLAVIAMNALWMAIDTDWNKAETLPEAATIFQFMEHSFCTYFSIELLIRFMAFKRKADGLRDAWFVFDSFLVALMVSETWLLLIVAAATNSPAKFPLGNAAVLRLLRLLRLSRLMRMLRSMPELMVLIRAMAVAVTSVMYVLCLLVGVTYIFGIACTQLSVGTAMHQVYFKNVALSMYSLIVYATFLDNLSNITDDTRAESLPVFCLVLLFIGVACCTLMNMLLGVLCEVISEVAGEEKATIKKTQVTEQMQQVALTLDTNSNGRVSAKEFAEIFHNADALRALEGVGVDPESVVDLASVMFFQDDGQEIDLPFDEFMDQVFELREENTAKLRDVKFVWSHIMPQLDKMKENVEIIKERLERIEEQALKALGHLRQIAEADEKLYPRQIAKPKTSPRTPRALF